MCTIRRCVDGGMLSLLLLLLPLLLYPASHLNRLVRSPMSIIDTGLAAVLA